MERDSKKNVRDKNEEKILKVIKVIIKDQEGIMLNSKVLDMSKMGINDISLESEKSHLEQMTDLRDKQIKNLEEFHKKERKSAKQSFILTLILLFFWTIIVGYAAGYNYKATNEINKHVKTNKEALEFFNKFKSDYPEIIKEIMKEKK